MMRDEVFESRIWLQVRMTTVNVFCISLHLQMAQAWGHPKGT